MVKPPPKSLLKTLTQHPSLVVRVFARDAISLFINDLETYLTSNESGNFTLSSLQTHLLLFADDLVLLADSHSGLQESI